jgi:diguanylate cyclase (GGDEF)-like protein
VAVLFIDLDGFKEVNDTLGHNAGDELLRLAAQRLKKTSRREDTVARYGGDEFVVALNDLADEREAEMAAARFLDIFAEPIPLEGANRKVTASIGISVFPYDGHDIGALLQHADKAMYMAKEDGGNRFVRYSRALA